MGFFFLGKEGLAARRENREGGGGEGGSRDWFLGRIFREEP